MNTAVTKTATIREDDTDKSTEINVPGPGDEYVESVELEAPENKVSIEEQIDNSDDPRQLIAKKHQEKHRNNSKSDNETGDLQNKSNENGENLANNPESNLVPIKVGGRIIQVEQERIDKAGGVMAYQKEVAVNQGFQDIATRKKELDLKADDLARREQELAAKVKAPSNQDESQNDSTANHNDLPVKGDHTVSDLVAQHREALLDGDDETADRAMTQLLSIRDSGNQQDTNEDRTADLAIEKIDRRNYVKAVTTAREKLYSDHPELKNDTRLFNLVDDETDLVRNENPGFTPQQVIETAYEQVINWQGGQKSPSLDSKLEEKRSITRPRSSAVRSKPAPAQRQQTRSEYVAELAKQRGQ